MCPDRLGVQPETVPIDRRARQRRLFTLDQLLGRAPIYVRRSSDRMRIALHLGFAAALLVLSAWWVVPPHAWAGPVLVTLAPSRGVHVGDLPTLGFVAVALRSLVVSTVGVPGGRRVSGS